MNIQLIFSQCRRSSIEPTSVVYRFDWSTVYIAGAFQSQAHNKYLHDYKSVNEIIFNNQIISRY